MDEHNENEQVNTNLGISRRTVLRRGAVVGGSLVWAAPAVQSITRSALAQTTGTPVQRCTGQAYNVLLTTSGLVGATVGPLNQSPADTNYPEDCIVDLTANVGGTTTDNQDEVVVGIACVENDFGTTCCTRSRLTTTTVNLNDLGLDVLLSADTITAEACASCGATPTASSSLVNATITVLGTTTNLNASPAPNTNVANLSVPGVLDVVLILNEQNAIPGGIEVNAVNLYVALRDALGAVTQEVFLILGHAHADVHDCP